MNDISHLPSEHTRRENMKYRNSTNTLSTYNNGNKENSCLHLKISTVPEYRLNFFVVLSQNINRYFFFYFSRPGFGGFFTLMFDRYKTLNTLVNLFFFSRKSITIQQRQSNDSQQFWFRNHKFSFVFLL